MIPGANLLNLALSRIARQPFQYLKFQSRAVNSIGLDVPVYSAPIPATGSAQPVPRHLFEAYGLDLQRNYMIFFLSTNLIDVMRDVAGDQIVYGGMTFQCISKTDWYRQDGWIEILAVQVPAA